MSRTESGWRFVAALVAISVVLPGCPRPKPEPLIPPELIDPHPTPEAKRRAALLSVYYHAWIVDHPRPEQGPPPIDLEQAAKILVDDDDPRAESRRQRAIVKLAVYGGDRPEHRQAIAILLGGASDLQPDLARVVSRGVRAGVPAPVVERHVDDFLQSRLLKPLSAQSCRTTFPVTMVRYDPFMGDTRAETRFRIERPLDQVATSLDPQNWVRCNPFFRDSYAVDSTAGPVLDACWGVAGQNPPKMTMPPVEGTGWSGRLFEHFVFDFAWVKWSWFRNLLVIDGSRTNTQYRFRFTLEDALCSRVLLDTAGGGFGIDDGYLEVTPAHGRPGWWEVTATKHLLFSGRPLMDLYLDLWSPILLWLLGDETRDQACCVP